MASGIKSSQDFSLEKPACLLCPALTGHVVDRQLYLRCWKPAPMVCLWHRRTGTFVPLATSGENARSIFPPEKWVLVSLSNWLQTVGCYFSSDSVLYGADADGTCHCIGFFCSILPRVIFFREGSGCASPSSTLMATGPAASKLTISACNSALVSANALSSVSYPPR